MNGNHRETGVTFTRPRWYEPNTFLLVAKLNSFEFNVSMRSFILKLRMVFQD